VAESNTGSTELQDGKYTVGCQEITDSDGMALYRRHYTLPYTKCKQRYYSSHPVFFKST